MGDLISKEKLKDYLERNISFGGVEKKFAFFDIIDSIPSADIMECARAIKEYCVNRVSHNPTMCDRCPIYKVMCGPDISCPYHWDLPEREKGGEEE